LQKAGIQIRLQIQTHNRAHKRQTHKHKDNNRSNTETYTASLDQIQHNKVKCKHNQIVKYNQQSQKYKDSKGIQHTNT